MNRAAIASATVLGLSSVLLLGCSPDTSSPSVTGNRDDVKHVTRKTHNTTEPVMGRKCVTTKGKTTCKQVKVGTRTTVHLDRQEKWCVELDNVNGEVSRDDVWFRVPLSTYNTMAYKREGTKVRMYYLNQGC